MKGVDKVRTDSAYYSLWHAAQKARRDYFDSYVNLSNGSNNIAEDKSLIATFLHEYNSRHLTPITLRQYLEESDEYD